MRAGMELREIGRQSIVFHGVLPNYGRRNSPPTVIFTDILFATLSRKHSEDSYSISAALRSFQIFI
jgi:hypothetical protein